MCTCVMLYLISFHLQGNFYIRTTNVQGLHFGGPLTGLCIQVSMKTFKAQTSSIKSIETAGALVVFTPLRSQGPVSLNLILHFAL